jgi:hypothetical protein
MTDGRYIDTSIGSLAGEGAYQKVTDREKRLQEIADGAVDRMPTAQYSGAAPTYYDRPVLKHPVWKWYIGAYFLSGGIAGASAVIGSAAQVFGGESMRPLVRRCRILATAGTTIGTGLLVADLGRPERFLNMLRVFRPTSPMSVGSWILAPATGAAAASVVLPGPLGEVAGLAAGALGGPLAGYTAVLTSNTAVPIWQATRRSLPAMYTSSATAGAAGVLSAIDPDDEVAHRLGIAARVSELASGLAVDREAEQVERVADPLKEGVSGALWKASKMLTIVSLVLSLLPGRKRWVRRLGAILGVAASSGAKFAIFRAGYVSGRDPRATFEQQRAGHGGAETMTSSRAR